jgi:DNA-binding SARP family transcriptional activator
MRVVCAGHWQNLGVPLASSPDSGLVRIQLCGPLGIERASVRLDGRLPGRQGRLLCAYLALHRHRAVPRAELITALWPGDTAASADVGLSALLSKLRGVLGDGSLTGRSAIRFTVPGVRVDLEDARDGVHRAESALAAHDCARAWAPAQIALFATERGFLDGEDGTDEYPWIDDERRRIDEMHRRALEAYGTACLGLGGAELPAAVRAGRALLDLAPYHESGARLLMRALAAQDNRAEAMHVYERVRITLHDQLGVSPSPATEALFAELNTL